MTQTKTSADRGSTPLESTTLEEKMRYILMAFILSCTEVSISKVPQQTETGFIPSQIDTTEQSTEPSTEPMEGIGGYIHYHLSRS